LDVSDKSEAYHIEDSPPKNRSFPADGATDVEDAAYDLVFPSCDVNNVLNVTDTSDA